MVKIVETVTFKDGATSETSKEFVDRIGLVKALQRGPFHNSVIYDLTKKGEATISFADASVHMKIIEDSDEVLANRVIMHGDNPGK